MTDHTFISTVDVQFSTQWKCVVNVLKQKQQHKHVREYLPKRQISQTLDIL